MKKIANEFQPELQGKKIRILSGDHAGEIAEVTSVEIFGGSVSVDLEGNRYYNVDEGNYEVIGEAKANESVTSWWGGIGDTDWREKILKEVNADLDLSFNDYWELPTNVQDDIYQLYAGGYSGEAKLKEAEPTGMYGYGSATGRMPPSEDWNQGGTMYGDPTSSMFNDFRGLSWNELPTDIQDAWKAERSYMSNEEIEGVATQPTDVEELDKLNQLYDNELEEELEGEDETEDIELIEDLIELELDEVGTEAFKEEEHPREEGGKFTGKGGGVSGKSDSELNKILDDPDSTQKERENAEKGLRDEQPTEDPQEPEKPSEVKQEYDKPKNTKKFNTVKAKILKAQGEPKDDYDRKRVDSVKNLEGFPTSGSQLEGLSVKYKTPILKLHLQDEHPDTTWSVRSEYFSGGSAINATYKGGSYPYGASQIGDIYSQRGEGYDPMTDYFPIDNYVSVYDSRPYEGRPRGDPQTIAKDRPDRLWSWVNLRFDEANDYDAGRTWSRKIAEDLIEGKGKLEAGYQGVSNEMMDTVKQVYTEFVEQERKEKAGESYTKEEDEGWGINWGESLKKSLEFEDSNRPVSPNTLQRYSEPIDLPTGKNALDQTYGVSEPETPDGQDLTGITIGDEEIEKGRGSVHDKGEFWTADLEPAEEEIIEKKFTPPKILYYKQYPFGRRAGKQNPFGEATPKIFQTFNSLQGATETEPTVGRGGRGTTDGKKINVKGAVDFEPNKNDNEKVWEFWQIDMETHEKVPNTTSKVIASTYGQAIDDYIADWNTNEKGSTIGYPVVEGKLADEATEQVSLDTMNKARVWWDNKYPERQWSDMRIGDRQSAILAFLRDPTTSLEAKEDYEGSECNICGLDEDEHNENTGHEFTPAIIKEQLEGDPTPWVSIGKIALDTAKDIMFPSKEQEGGVGGGAPAGNGGAPAGNGAPANGGEPSPEEEEPSRRIGFFGYGRRRCPEGKVYRNGKCVSEEDKEDDLSQLAYMLENPEEKPENLPIISDLIDKRLTEEGGLGSGKKGHQDWMRAIEEEKDYDFCENCNMITERVNNKCEMCGKRVE